MKNILNFQSFNEKKKFSEKEIDNILDKMNKGKSLTREEEFILRNPDGKKEDFKKTLDYKDTLIEDIISKVERYGSYITIRDMEADSSPVYKYGDQEIHLIERITSSDVEVVIYGGYKYESELGSYDVKYDELTIETLEEINDLLDQAIENNLLEEDI
ncbi:MAG: hypothetical protein HPY57_13825 [Ignavibacteria bacterium]|nr:hypothetical protein [Ignavibacteria bacterium]